MRRKAAPGPGRPKTSPLPRAEQLRAAKHRQRVREREAGLKTVELRLPGREAERLRIALSDSAFRGAARHLVDDYVVDLHAWPALRDLAWNRADRWIPAREALALYERNWRFVDAERLGEEERAFIARLSRRFGGGPLHA